MDTEKNNFLFELGCEEKNGNSVKVIFNVDKDFRKWFKKTHGINRWNEKKFHTVIENSIKSKIQEAKTKNPEITILFCTRLLDP